MREASERPTAWLWVLAALLLVGCVVGGIQVWRVQDAREAEAARHARYAEALAAATGEAEAFVNVDHRSAQADLARIAAGATGPLRQRYTEDAERIARSIRRDRLVTEGEVLWAGVVRVDASGGTVLVATAGTRSDRRTDGPVDRDLRLRVRLVSVDGEWLASDIEQVD